MAVQSVALGGVTLLLLSSLFEFGVVSLVDAHGVHPYVVPRQVGPSRLNG